MKLTNHNNSVRKFWLHKTLASMVTGHAHVSDVAGISSSWLLGPHQNWVVSCFRTVFRRA